MELKSLPLLYAIRRRGYEIQRNHLTHELD